MGALTTLAQAVGTPITRSRYGVSQIAGQTTAQWIDLWKLGSGNVGVTPTTAVVPTNATTGAIRHDNSAGGGAQKWLSRFTAQMTAYDGQNTGGFLVICDRLSHQGGLSGTTTGAQTTNLPTAALTRYTSGVGVHAGLSVYTAVGATQTTVTCSYTNSNGTAGQATPLVQCFQGSSNVGQVTSFVWLPLASGDVGVKSVENVALTATTGTAGAFGVVLFRPLLAIPMAAAGMASRDTIVQMAGQLPEVLDNACLFALLLSPIASGNFTPGVMELETVEA